MGKPTAAPIVFTYGYDQYRSKIEETYGRGRNSLITIKKVGNSKPVSEIHLRSISPESEERLLKLISQGWWLEFKKMNRGDNALHAESLNEFKYLVAQGVDEPHALRATIVLNSSDHKFTMQGLFEKFSSTDAPLLYDNKGYSNFERFIEVSVRFNTELAKKIIASAGSNKARLDNLYNSLSAFRSDPQGAEYLPEMSDLQLKNFEFFRSFINTSYKSNGLTLTRLISEIPESKWKTIEIQVDRMRRDMGIFDYLDDRDMSLWLASNCSKGLMTLLKDHLSVRSMVNWERLLCILMGRYGLRVLIDAVGVFGKEKVSGFPKDVVNLINVANFLEQGGPSEAPMAWILALSEPESKKSDEDDLENIVY